MRSTVRWRLRRPRRRSACRRTMHGRARVSRRSARPRPRRLRGQFWTYHRPLPPDDAEPREYAHALERMHAAMREVDVASPHFMVTTWRWERDDVLPNGAQLAGEWLAELRAQLAAAESGHER